MAQPDNRNALRADTVLLEYRITSVLAADGFGITYLARDTVLQKNVVIKEYFPSDLAARSPDGGVTPVSADTAPNCQKGLAQFLVDARTLSRFVHPNIVRVDRYFEANGTAYMLREYEKGESVAQLFAREPQPAEAALKQMLRPLLDGLEAVHRAGVLHRDIKPGNIFLRDEDEGSPVLIDFGAARLASRDAMQDIIPILTPGYAPVEQYIRSGRQGPWSDIYSLAGVLFWAVTGEHPQDALSRIRMDNVPKTLNAARMWYSAPFIEAIQWALMVEEDKRPRDVGEWRKALFREEPKRADARVVARSESDSTRKYVWVALGVVIFYLFVEGADIVKQREQSRATDISTFRNREQQRMSPGNLRPAADDRSAGLSRDELASNLPHLVDRFSEIDADRNGRVTTEELQAYWKRVPK